MSNDVYSDDDYNNQRLGYEDAREHRPVSRGDFWYLFGYFCSQNYKDKHMHHANATLAATLANPHTVPPVLRRSLLNDD